MPRVLTAMVVVVSLLAAANASAQCAAGQTLQKATFSGTQTVQERGCAGKAASGADRKEGHWVTFYASGKKKSEATYQAGKKEGVATWYYESGKKMWEYTYKADKMDGPSTEWSESGEKTAQDVYKNDNLVKAP